MCAEFTGKAQSPWQQTTVFSHRTHLVGERICNLVIYARNYNHMCHTVLKAKVKGLFYKKETHTHPAQWGNDRTQQRPLLVMSCDRLERRGDNSDNTKREGVIQCDSGLYKVRVGFMQRLKDWGKCTELIKQTVVTVKTPRKVKRSINSAGCGRSAVVWDKWLFVVIRNMVGISQRYYYYYYTKNPATT